MIECAAFLDFWSQSAVVLGIAALFGFFILFVMVLAYFKP